MLNHQDAPRDEITELVLGLRDIYNTRYAESPRLDKLSRAYWFAVGFLGVVAVTGIALVINWLDPNHWLSSAFGW